MAGSGRRLIRMANADSAKLSEGKHAQFMWFKI